MGNGDSSEICCQLTVRDPAAAALNWFTGGAQKAITGAGEGPTYDTLCK